MDVGFEHGVPVSLDGTAMGLVDLIQAIDAIGGAHGFGRVDMIENRLVGIKSREIYEVPGALALITAHKELEDMVLTRDLIHFKRTIESKLADMIYEGQWFDPLTDACKAFLLSTQPRVTGTILLKFFKGVMPKAAGHPSASTATSSPPTPRKTSSHIMRLPASPSSGACRSRCGPGSVTRWTPTASPTSS